MSDRVPTAPKYRGELHSYRALEQCLTEERSAQDEQLQALVSLREQSQRISGDMQQALASLAEEARGLERPPRGRHALVAWFTSLWKGTARTERSQHGSVEAVLKAHYERSVQSARCAADFVDRLAAAEQVLFDEIERLNLKIVECASNESLAAAHILRLKAEVERCSASVAEAPQALALRETELDRLQRALSEHVGMFELFRSAQPRLAGLKGTTKQLRSTISQLLIDLRRYLEAANTSLDEASARIQALGAAADSAFLVGELRHSIGALNRSMHTTAAFVSETQLYLREHLDALLHELEFYDEQTRALLALNADFDGAPDSIRVHRALSEAEGLRNKSSATGPGG